MKRTTHLSLCNTCESYARLIVHNTDLARTQRLSAALSSSDEIDANVKHLRRFYPLLCTAESLGRGGQLLQRRANFHAADAAGMTLRRTATAALWGDQADGTSEGIVKFVPALLYRDKSK